LSKAHYLAIMLIMKKILLVLFILTFIISCKCFAYENNDLRDYSGIELARGSFIPVMNVQEISTQSFDVGSKVKFISTNDLFLYETNIIPKQTEFYGYIDKINEPIIGTNASMIIKVTKLKFVDGFEIPMRGYIYSTNGNLLGGELTAPASFDSKQSLRLGFASMVGCVPGPTRRMGEQKIIPSGSDLMIILVSPLFITHTVTN